MMRVVVMVSALFMLRCTDSNPGWNSLYPVQTLDCSRWLDGSFYPVDGRELGRVDVGANAPNAPRGINEVVVLYFLPRGEVIRLDQLEFKARRPDGKVVAMGKPRLWDNALEKEQPKRYSPMPMELASTSKSDQPTLYFVSVTFDIVLPDRFDLVLPDVWLRDKRYPVRIFSYNYFPDRQMVGLCG